MAKTTRSKVSKDTYEILPQDILETLRYDVEALKQKLEEPQNKTNELILEIESLKDSIHELNDVFKKALHQTEDEDIYKTIKSLNERIEAVQTQNETIAKGMLAISDKIEGFVNSQKGSQLRPNPVSMQKQSAAMPRLTPGPANINNLPPQMRAVHQGMAPPKMPSAPRPPSPPGAKKRSFF